MEFRIWHLKVLKDSVKKKLVKIFTNFSQVNGQTMEVDLFIYLIFFMAKHEYFSFFLSYLYYISKHPISPLLYIYIYICVCVCVCVRTCV